MKDFREIRTAYYDLNTDNVSAEVPNVDEYLEIEFEIDIDVDHDENGYFSTIKLLEFTPKIKGLDIYNHLELINPDFVERIGLELGCYVDDNIEKLANQEFENLFDKQADKIRNKLGG